VTVLGEILSAECMQQIVLRSVCYLIVTTQYVSGSGSIFRPTVGAVLKSYVCFNLAFESLGLAVCMSCCCNATVALALVLLALVEAVFWVY
jgi:hypothetical protein